MNADEQLLPLPVAAERLAISIQTLRRWHREGKVELVRLPSGSVRIAASRLASLMKEVSQGD